MKNPILDPQKTNLNSNEKELEKALRPSKFSDFTGQDTALKNLLIFVKAAKKRNESLDHVLLHGPPGLGKTTLAYIIAKEMDTQVVATSGPVLDKPSDLAGLLTNLEANNVLFIDEIHRLNPIVEEYLYTAMEDFKIDIMLDSGPNARTVQIKLNPFTLVGATTRSGLLTAPLRARFGINMRLNYYSNSQLRKIVIRSCQLLKIVIDENAAIELASRSRGTPRIANNLLRRTRDFAQVEGEGIIDESITKVALKALNVDENGLDEMDNKILRTIVEVFSGGPVGINNIAMSCSEQSDTIEEVYEPYLIQEGYLKRTNRGRKATKKAYEYLKIPLDSAQKSLFDE